MFTRESSVLPASTFHSASRGAVLLCEFRLSPTFVFALHPQRVVLNCIHFQPLLVCCESVTLHMPPSSASIISPFPPPSIYIIPHLVSSLVSALPSHCSTSASFFCQETVSAPCDTAESESPANQLRRDFQYLVCGSSTRSQFCDQCRSFMKAVL